MRRPVGVILAVVLLLLAGIARGREQSIAFINEWDIAVDVHIGGDRVMILAPHSVQGLPYTVDAWTWPRRIEFREHGSGRLLLSTRASGGDLATRHWRVELR